MHIPSEETRFVRGEGDESMKILTWPITVFLILCFLFGCKQQLPTETLVVNLDLSGSMTANRQSSRKVLAALVQIASANDYDIIITGFRNEASVARLPIIYSGPARLGRIMEVFDQFTSPPIEQGTRFSTTLKYDANIARNRNVKRFILLSDGGVDSSDWSETRSAAQQLATLDGVKVIILPCLASLRGILEQNCMKALADKGMLMVVGSEDWRDAARAILHRSYSSTIKTPSGKSQKQELAKKGANHES